MNPSRWSVVALVFVGVLCVSSLIVYAAAGEMNFVSDLILTSAPSTAATHIIQFTISHAIPAGGEIVITPETGAFTIPPDLDYTDIEFSVSTGGGPYNDRPIASVADATNDGIMVTPGANGSFVITLNSTDGIDAGTAVRVSIGTVGAGVSVINPVSVRSYGIRIVTYDVGQAPIDSANAMIAVVDPVALDLPTDLLRPTVFNGLPSGEIAAGNPTIELSVETLDLATCRYATSSGVAYSAMPGTFIPTMSTLLYTDVSGFVDGTSYTFYVRCINDLGNSNNTDYPISFFLDPTPSILTSSTDTGSSTVSETGGLGYLGPGGQGNFPNGSAYLYLASVTLSGFSIPLSTVTILKDGKNGATAQTGTDGSFSAKVDGLERGTYTFQAYTTDTAGTNSASYASTLSVSQATQNNISNVLIPPIIFASKDSVVAGDPLTISGAGIPNDAIQVTVRVQSANTAAINTHTYTATSSVTGTWQVPVDTSVFIDGTYVVSAREIQPDQTRSGFSTPVVVTVGQIGASCSSKPDMNHDSKVNLIDFSIFLTFWGQTGPQGDFNCDQKVNLADFSIMLFNWTG